MRKAYVQLHRMYLVRPVRILLNSGQVIALVHTTCARLELREDGGCRRLPLLAFLALILRLLARRLLWLIRLPL